MPPEDQTETLLLTLTGADRPGVTRTLFDTLATVHPIVLDVEQTVTRLVRRRPGRPGERGQVTRLVLGVHEEDARGIRTGDDGDGDPRPG